VAELHVLGQIERWGETFNTVRPGAWSLMEFAKVASDGTDSTDLAGLVAMRNLIEACIHPEDMARFTRACSKARADGKELMGIVAEVIAQVAERPTTQPSDSSAGLRTTNASSAGGSSSPAVSLMESRKRGDLALVHRDAEESRASA
jgi:hypothetical protein